MHMRQIIANLALFIFSFNLLLFEGKEIKADESGVNGAVNITASDIIEMAGKISSR